jgi:hypothetical protein
VVSLELSAVFGRKPLYHRRKSKPPAWQSTVIRGTSGLVRVSGTRGPLAETKSSQSKQRLRQLGQKTAWYLNFDINAFDLIEGKE